MVDKDPNCIVIESDSDDDVEFVAETKNNAVIGATLTPIILKKQKKKKKAPFLKDQVRHLFSNVVEIADRPGPNPVIIERLMNESPITELQEELIDMPPQFNQGISIVSSETLVVEQNPLLVAKSSRNVCRKSTSRGQKLRGHRLLKPSTALSGVSLNSTESSTSNVWDGPKLGAAFSLGSYESSSSELLSSSPIPSIPTMLACSSLNFNTIALQERTSDAFKPVNSVSPLLDVCKIENDIGTAHDLKPAGLPFSCPDQPEPSSDSTSLLRPKSANFELLQKPKQNAGGSNVKTVAKTGLTEKKVKKHNPKDTLKGDATIHVMDLKRLLPGGENSDWSLGECLQRANKFIPQLCDTDLQMEICYLKQVDQNISKTYEVDRLLGELREMCSSLQDKDQDSVSQETADSKEIAEENKENECQPSTSIDSGVKRSYENDYFQLDQMAFSFHNYWDKLHQYDTFLSHLDACAKGDEPNSILDIAESNYRAYSEKFCANPEPVLEEIDLKEKLESLKSKLGNRCDPLLNDEKSSDDVKIFDTKDEDEEENLYELEDVKSSTSEVVKAEEENNSEPIKLVISSYRTLESFNFDSEDENDCEEVIPMEESLSSEPVASKEATDTDHIIEEPCENLNSEAANKTGTEINCILPLDLSSKEKMKDDSQNDLGFTESDSKSVAEDILENKALMGINYTLQGPENKNSGATDLQKVHEETSDICQVKKYIEEMKPDETTNSKKDDNRDMEKDVSHVAGSLLNSTEADLQLNDNPVDSTETDLQPKDNQMVEQVNNDPTVDTVNIPEERVEDEKLDSFSNREDSDSSITLKRRRKTSLQESQNVVKSVKIEQAKRRSLRLAKTVEVIETNKNSVEIDSIFENETDSSSGDSSSELVIDLPDDLHSTVDGTITTLKEANNSSKAEKESLINSESNIETTISSNERSLETQIKNSNSFKCESESTDSSRSTKNNNASKNSKENNVKGTVSSCDSSESGNTISSRDSSVSNIKSTISSRDSSVSNIKSTISSRDSSVSNIKSTTSSRDSSESNIKSTISSRDSSVSNIKSTTSSRDSSESNIKSTISSRDSSVSNIKSTISSQDSSVSNSESIISSSEGSEGNVKGTVSSLDSSATKVKSTIPSSDGSESVVKKSTISSRDGLGGNIKSTNSSQDGSEINTKSTNAAKNSSESKVKSIHLSNENNLKRLSESSLSDNYHKDSPMNKRRKTLTPNSKPPIKKVTLEKNTVNKESRKKTVPPNPRTSLGEKPSQPTSEQKSIDEKSKKLSLVKQKVTNKKQHVFDKIKPVEVGRDNDEEEAMHKVQLEDLSVEERKILARKFLEKRAMQDKNKVFRPKKKYDEFDLNRMKMERALKTMRFKKINKDDASAQDVSKASSPSALPKDKNVSEQGSSQMKTIPKIPVKGINKTPGHTPRSEQPKGLPQAQADTNIVRENVPDNKSRISNKGQVKQAPGSGTGYILKGSETRNEMSKEPNQRKDLSTNNQKKEWQKVNNEGVKGRFVGEKRKPDGRLNLSLQERKEWQSGEKRRDSPTHGEWHNRDPRKRLSLDSRSSSFSTDSWESSEELPRHRPTEPRLIDQLIRSRQLDSEQYTSSKEDICFERRNKTDHNRPRNQRQAHWEEDYQLDTEQYSSSKEEVYFERRGETDHNRPRNQRQAHWEEDYQNRPKPASDYRYSERSEYQSRSFSTKWEADYDSRHKSSDYSRFSETSRDYQSRPCEAETNWGNQNQRSQNSSRPLLPTPPLDSKWRYQQEKPQSSWQSLNSENRDNSMLSRIRNMKH